MSVELIAPVSRPAEYESYANYRALSASAVASCAIGLLSACTLLSYDYGWALGLIPILGIVLSIKALVTVRKNSREMTGAGFAKAGLLLSLVFLISGWGLAGYVYATEVPPGYERLTYRELQPNSRNPLELLPPSVEKWDGKRVFIKGYVYPVAQQNGLRKFVLCRDNGDCCFGGKPPLTDKILVTLKDPLRLNYSTRVQRLAGTFKVEPEAAINDSGEVVYQLEADYLK